MIAGRLGLIVLPRAAAIAVLIVVVIVVALAPARTAAANPGTPDAVTVAPGDSPPPPVNQRAGWTVAIVEGGPFDFAAVQLAYAVPVWRRWLQVAPFVAAGIAWQPWTPRYSAGVTASLGWKHRLALSVAAGRLASESLSLHGTIVDRQALFGVAAGGGYEYLSPAGSLFRLLMEGEFAPGTRLHANRWEPGFQLTLAIGQRF